MADDDPQPQALYVRGMNMPKGEIEDMWDDTALNYAYDKALEMANAAVAKRVAMDTNSNANEDSTAEEVQEKKPKPKKGKPSKPQTHTWKAGTPCRAVYEEDGLEYEAFVTKMINDSHCIVKFLGYNNEQRTLISSLKPTLGNDARMAQVKAALGDKRDDGFESQPSEPGQGTASPVGRPNNKKKKSQKKTRNNSSGTSDIGELPHFAMPNMNMFRNMTGSMPIPPPPPLDHLSHRDDDEEQAILDMLVTWYMTGYYTGLYQGIKRQKRNGNGARN